MASRMARPTWRRWLRRSRKSGSHHSCAETNNTVFAKIRMIGVGILGAAVSKLFNSCHVLPFPLLLTQRTYLTCLRRQAHPLGLR